MFFKKGNKVFETVSSHLEDDSVIWKATDHELANLTFEYTIWVSNGMGHIALYRPIKYEFSMEEREKLYGLIRKKMEQLFFELVDNKFIEQPQKVTVIRNLIGGS